MEEYVWISKLANHPAFSGHAHHVLHRLAEQYDIKITADGPNDLSEEAYLEAINAAVERRVSGIIITGWGEDAAVEAVNRAVDAGVPVVTVDCDIPGSRRLAHIGTDWFRMGWAMADKMSGLTGDKGDILLLGMPGLPHIEAGYRGFKVRMAGSPDIRLIGPVDDSDTGDDKAREITLAYLREYPDLKGIAGFDGNSGPGAARALLEQNRRGRVRLVCVDAEQPHLDFISRGVIDAAFGQKKGNFTFHAFQMLYSFNHGSAASGFRTGAINIPGNINTGHIVVTKDNLDSFDCEMKLDEAFEHHELSKRYSVISSMVESCSEPAMATDLNGQLVYANPATYRFFGFTEGQMFQSDIKGLFDLSDKHFEKLYGDIKCGDACWVEVSAQNQNGPVKSFHLTISPIKKNDSVRGAVVIATDITERKESDRKRTELQEKLKRAEKMESLGILAGGVAHDLNNMLGPLVGYSDLILEQLGPEHGLVPMIQKIGRSARNAADIILDLLTLARRGRYAMLPTDINEVVRAYLESTSYLKVKAGNPAVLVNLQLDESVKSISGSFSHLQKVIMNLVVNAYDAMPGGGRLNIRTSQEYVEELISGHVAPAPGEYILVRVKDNGMGIESEEINKIFEPYYSKKKEGVTGGGLGLSVVYGIVKDHGGYYDIFTEVDKGTEFVLYFPVSTETVQEKAENKSGLELKMGANETVLVVDDVAEQRELAAEILTNLGYKVVTVKNGREAVRYTEYHAVDLIMLDMIMEKDFDGLDTYREIIRTHPDQKVIVVSGFSQTDRVQKVLELGAGQYIRKPYSLKDLADALRRELDNRVPVE